MLLASCGQYIPKRSANSNRAISYRGVLVVDKDDCAVHLLFSTLNSLFWRNRIVVDGMMQTRNAFVLRFSSKMAFHAKRVGSFNDSPQELQQMAAKLAEAGFYYFPENSETGIKCYFCNLQLDQWIPDDPWIVHEDNCKECPLVCWRKVATKSMTIADAMRLETAKSCLETERKYKMNIDQFGKTTSKTLELMAQRVLKDLEN